MYEQIVKEKLEGKGFNEFILKTDMALVESWAAAKSTSISFRSAGNDTLRCLERGAGAKPHKILDKSLKRKNPENPSDEDKENNAIVDAFFNGFSSDDKKDAENLLMGLVGHWNKREAGGTEVDGLFLTELGKEELSRSGLKIAGADTPTPYLLLADAEQKKALMKFFMDLPGSEMYKLYRFSRLFFSGDYDTHDLLQVNSPVASSSDMMLLESLRRDMLGCRIAYLTKWYGMTQADIDEEKKKEREKDGIIESDYCRIQHGPQFNYTAQMANENLKSVLNYIKTPSEDGLKNLNGLVYKVMYTSLPVMACDSGNEWVTLTTMAQLEDYYKDRGNTLKETWTNKNTLEKHIIHIMATILRLKCGVGTFRSDFLKENDNPNLEKNKNKKNAQAILLKAVPAFRDVYGDDKLKDYAKKAIEVAFPL